MKATTDFKLKKLLVGIEGADVAFTINNLLTLTYIEDIKSASIQMYISLTYTKKVSYHVLLVWNQCSLNLKIMMEIILLKI